MIPAVVADQADHPLRHPPRFLPRRGLGRHLDLVAQSHFYSRHPIGMLPLGPPADPPHAVDHLRQAGVLHDLEHSAGPHGPVPIVVAREESGIQHQPIPLVDVIGDIVGALQCPGIVGDVVAGGDGEEDQIGGILPDFIPEHELLLGGTVPAVPEVEYFDRPPQHPCQPQLDQLAKRLLEGDLERLDVGVAQQGDAVGAPVGLEGYFGAAPPVTVDLDPGPPLVLEAAPRAGNVPHAKHRIGPYEDRIADAEQPDDDLRDEQRNQDGTECQGGIAGPPPCYRSFPRWFAHRPRLCRYTPTTSDRDSGRSARRSAGCRRENAR
jgi:hypothetical protein